MVQVSPATTKPYDRAVPTWLQLYCVIHFVLVLYGTDELGRAYKVSKCIPVIVLVMCLSPDHALYGQHTIDSVLHILTDLLWTDVRLKVRLGTSNVIQSCAPLSLHHT